MFDVFLVKQLTLLGCNLPFVCFLPIDFETIVDTCSYFDILLIHTNQHFPLDIFWFLGGLLAQQLIHFFPIRSLTF